MYFLQLANIINHNNNHFVFNNTLSFRIIEILTV